MMDGIDGLETARRLRALGSEALLVFVTTEAGYALEGYEVEAAGFLVKGRGRVDRGALSGSWTAFSAGSAWRST